MVNMNSLLIAIGRYRGHPVARGGFATVYQVVTGENAVPLALKWANEGAGPDIAASLVHEYAVLSELAAPFVPRAHNLGWEMGRPYLVTDWVGGAPLWKLDGIPESERFATVLRHAAQTLVFLHGRGWVHGDLKPDNFLWNVANTNNGEPVLNLLDFGLARPVGDLDRPRGAGTVGYLAPEFLQLKPADARADWYSLGVILYEWLYGERPFAAADPADEVAAHLEREPEFDRPSRRAAPEWARAVIERLLRKQPDDRGASEYDILAWICQHDPAIDAEAILHEQVDFHRMSEDLRIGAGEDELGAQISAGTLADSVSGWGIATDALTGDRILRAARQRMARKAVHAPDRWIDATRDAPGESSVRLLPPSSASLDSGTGVPGAATLPWDHETVGEYLLAVTGDKNFVRRWTTPVTRVTSGLPTIVSDFMSFVISEGALDREDGGWELAPDALSLWTIRPESLFLYQEYIGELSPDERRVCDYFAVGRGFFQIDILSELWPHGRERFKSAFDGLRARGILTPVVPSRTTGFFDWRLRFGGLADCWRAQMPLVVRRQIAMELATAIESCSVDSDTHVLEVLAELFADSRSWDKCVHFGVSAVTAHLKAGRQEQAQPYIALAISAAAEIPPGRTQLYWSGRAQMALGDYQKACGQIDEALRTYRLLLRLGRQSDDRRLLAETLKDLGDLYRQMRQFEKGVRVLRRARQLYEGMGDRAEVALTLNNLGNMYWVSSDYAEAERYYAEALRIARELGDLRIEALALSNLGVAHKSSHDYIRAEACYLESLAIKEQLNSPTETARTLNNLGVIALDQGQLAKAAEYFDRAIALNRQGGAEAEVVFNHGNLVQVYLERGDLRQAINLGEATILDADQLGDPATGAELRAFMAEAYLRAGDFGVAGQLLQDAERVAAGQTNDDLRAHLALVAALRAYRLGQIPEAIALLDDADQAFARAEMPRLRADAIVIRLNAAVAMDDPDATASWWRKGQAVAGMASARHKVAQLAFARLPEDPARGFPREAMVAIDAFLAEGEQWQWTGEYRIWQSRYQVSRGDLRAAEECANRAVAKLRADGNWESLWRALAVLGMICQKRTDYEPALAAFDEAQRILDVIANTIEDGAARSTYLASPLCTQLAEGRRHIMQMTS